ncbi:hypothetical protein Tco_0740619 [Tanacetum coccineum]
MSNQAHPCCVYVKPNAPFVVFIKTKCTLWCVYQNQTHPLAVAGDDEVGGGEGDVGGGDDDAAGDIGGGDGDVEMRRMTMAVLADGDGSRGGVAAAVGGRSWPEVTGKWEEKWRLGLLSNEEKP